MIRSPAEALRPPPTDVDLDTFFDVSLDLLVVRELDGPVVKASASWFSVLGYRPDELVGQLLPSLVHPDDQPATQTAILEVTNRRPGDPVLGQINRYRHRDGHYVTLEWRAQRFGDRIYAVARDVTAKVAAERALIEAKAAAEAASRAKSDFLANMSHEVRTPLNGVIGIVDALSRTALDPAQTEMVNLIRASGVTLERLVSDILDVSKIEAGELTLETRPFDLDEALDAPLDVMRVRADEKGLRFDVIRDDEARGVFVGDSTRIRQVIGNLLSNAVKFTHQGGVSVRIALDEDHDSLTHLIVDIQDRFRIEIPLARSTSLSDYVAGERARAAEVPAPMHTIRVLLAEDHPTNQRVVQLILAGHPVELITVEDGAQAVTAFQAGSFDVILMDMQMPGMDGLTATRTIRELEATRAANIHTPIIMLSANAMAQHREQAIQAGADIHVPKPITAASLLAGIQAVLQT